MKKSLLITALLLGGCLASGIASADSYYYSSSYRSVHHHGPGCGHVGYDYEKHHYRPHARHYRRHHYHHGHHHRARWRHHGYHRSGGRLSVSTDVPGLRGYVDMHF